MFNMWKRTYVQTFNQRNFYDTNTLLADANWANVIMPDTLFRDGGALIHQTWSLDDLVNTAYSGQYSNLLVELLTESDKKWAIVVQHNDYYKLLAYYLKELQFAFKLPDEDLHMLAFSYMYNNFYYSNDQLFTDGFVGQTFQTIMRNVFTVYQPVGVLRGIAPVDLPTEVGYFLIKRGLVSEDLMKDKFVNAAKMVVSRLWQVHKNDFSEWLILDTQHFLNALKSPSTPEVVTDEFSFVDMFNLIASDDYLNSMFFTSFPFFSSPATWDSDPNFKITASRLVNAWEGLADYLVERGIDAEWAELRHSQYAEIILRYDYVKGTCKAVKYLLGLEGAVEELDQPVIDLLGYDLLSECFDTKYNKTLLLLTLRGMSNTYKQFIQSAFETTNE